MKRAIGLGCVLAITGCASAPPAPRQDGFLGGEAGDLRVLLDDRCPQAHPAPFQPYRNESDKGLEDYAALPGLAFDMLSNIGGIAFESFGNYLKRAGQADISRSVGANGGLFYTSPSSGDVTINPSIRCMYIVRNGFGPQTQPFSQTAAPDLRQTWTRLKLTRTPDLFAVAYIETSGDIGGGALAASAGEASDTGAPVFWNPKISPPYFRLKLDRLYINRFQSIGAAPSRDLAVILNYGLAATRTVVQAEGANAGVPELASKFAVGGIRLAGARASDYQGAALTALQSAWMPVPGVKSYDPRATVDVVAYVVEFSPGNPMLEEIGEYLAGPDVRRKVETVISQAAGESGNQH
ncbi:MAG: hypothetical protein ABL956_05220 [Hyphomonadaceae bacterium]